MSGYELHCHSNISDGSQPPAEVVRVAKDAGMDGLALTDHDSTLGLDDARAEGERLGVEVITGCEISSQWKGTSCHILAYFFDPADARLAEELQWIVDDRVLRAEKMVQKLQEMGVPITMDQVRRLAGDGVIARPHVAAAMVESGVVRSTVDAFTPEWIADGGKAYVGKRTLVPEETVDVIREAGGVAVIAHPIWVEREVGGTEQLIDMLAERGLAGVEVAHPDQDPDARATFGAIADRLGLIRTGSSDYHGNDHGPVIGINPVEREVVEALRARKPAG